MVAGQLGTHGALVTRNAELEHHIGGGHALTPVRQKREVSASVTQ